MLWHHSVAFRYPAVCWRFYNLISDIKQTNISNVFQLAQEVNEPQPKQHHDVTPRCFRPTHHTRSLHKSNHFTQKCGFKTTFSADLTWSVRSHSNTVVYSLHSAPTDQSERSTDVIKTNNRVHSQVVLLLVCVAEHQMFCLFIGRRPCWSQDSRLSVILWKLFRDLETRRFAQILSPCHRLCVCVSLQNQTYNKSKQASGRRKETRERESVCVHMNVCVCVHPSSVVT